MRTSWDVLCDDPSRLAAHEWYVYAGIGIGDEYMPTANLTEFCDLAIRLARRHYEYLRYHEGDPLDVPWSDLPDPQKLLWTASMADLLDGLTIAERQRLVETQPIDFNAPAP